MVTLHVVERLGWADTPFALSFAAAGCIGLMLTGCGGGSGGGNSQPADTTAPRIVSVTPANGARDVPRVGSVKVAFDEAMNCVAMASADLTLHDAQGNNIGGNLTCHESELTFTPNARVPELTVVTARVAGRVKDRAGNRLGADYVWEFTVRANAWSTPGRVSSDSVEALRPRIAVGPDGNAVAVWHQNDGARYAIAASSYAAAGWSTPMIIDGGAGEAISPRIAVDPSGGAIAAWSQRDAGGKSIWINRYSPTSGWGSAEQLSSVAPDAGDSDVAIDESGNAVVVWTQESTGTNGIWASRYVPGTGWSAAEVIEASETGLNALQARIAYGANGEAVVIWKQFDGAHYSVRASRHTTSGWSAPVWLEQDDAGDASEPALIRDTNGDVVAAWTHFDGTSFSIWSNRYSAASGWGGVAPVENDLVNSTAVRLAASGQGPLFATWIQWEGGTTRIAASRYSAASGWSPAELLGVSELGAIGEHAIATDAHGNAIVLWAQPDTNHLDLWHNRYRAGGGWGTAALLENGGGDADMPDLGIDASGSAIAVWQQDDSSTLGIRSSRFE